MMMTQTIINMGDRDMVLTEVDTRGELWHIVQEAHDYLHAYLYDPTSRIYSEGGVVHFSASDWGYRTKDGCKVCLAGLWYLKKENVLLGDLLDVYHQPLPQIADFLDDLRRLDMDPDLIEDWLGISVPDDLDTELAVKATGDECWDEDNIHHILAFLKWLLEHKPQMEEVMSVGMRIISITYWHSSSGC